MSSTPLDVVTGAFSYTGRHIAERLLADGRRVRTLSRNPGPAGSPIEHAPLQFIDRAALTESLAGAETLYVTYWIRFPHGGSTFERAVKNTAVLARAAREAGVRRLVYVSVSNPSPDSKCAYFRGKAAAEQAVAASGMSYAVVRPTLVFGPEDVLVNNIAWILRRFPLFLVPGRGAYCVQPVAVEEVAALCVEAGLGDSDETLDAAGPEVLSFDALVRLVRDAVGSRARVVHTPVEVALGLSRAMSVVVRDVVLTREELDGLAADLLVSAEPPRARRSFAAWVQQNGAVLGRTYSNELTRNFRGRAPL